jgi:homoprotocatechuate degradation regulator HpaR
MSSRSSPFIHRNLPLLLLQTREVVFARFRPLLNEAGVTEQQWRVIRALLAHGPLEPREIAQVCCFSSPSMAGILARMDELGWVVREQLAHDQRRVRVSVSESGQALARALAPRIEAAYAELEQQLGPQNSQALIDILERVQATLK